ncbi:HNH endonuclease [Saccharothrix australiensis]|uniref:HNH endonuclease n=1 Tax=Saccharothrix australiensis TaxID=2072 RepID=A0A495W7X1_9PSEU|nr:HNH endonuclease [Saccharothrix australiensis]RKT56723.1 HNH endonuclease [Saccharothrix australiensis]
MGYTDVRRQDVVAAMAEYDRKGREAFLAEYGYDKARLYVLVHDGKRYDSKAIVGVAHKYRNGTALRHDQLIGGRATVGRHLVALGFRVDGMGAPAGGARSGPEDDAEPSGARPTSAERAGWSTEEFLARLITLDRRRAEQSGKRQALALLWAIGRWHGRATRWHAEEDFCRGVGDVLRDYDGDPGPEAVKDLFWHLEGTGVWRVDATAAGTGPVAGFDDRCHELLSSVQVRTRAINALRGRHLDDITETEELLASLGLADYARAGGRPRPRTGPARRRRRSGDVVARRRSVADHVIALHDHTCQFCGTRLLTGVGFYSECAHIRGVGAPHHGPDDLGNALCLCPNCHARFDRFGIYVDADGVVRQVHDNAVLGELRHHPEHEVDEEHIRYHRELCRITPE